MKLVKILQDTNNKFLNMFTLVFEGEEGKEIQWTMASRRNLDDLLCVSKNIKADTVRIVPIIKHQDGSRSVILIKEFRLPINDYVYSFPAGIVEKGENPMKSALRELNEEIGAKKVADLHQVTDVCFNSEGMTDETVILYEATVLSLGKQNLQGDEDIKMLAVKIEDLPQFMKGKSFNTQAGTYLTMLYRENKLLKQLNNEHLISKSDNKQKENLNK
ncbi:MAG: NUDIX hydrolase [Candidatus Caccovivens sp.]